MISRKADVFSKSAADDVKSLLPKDQIMASQFFDETYYGHGEDRETAVDHYLTVGEPEGRQPSALFDPQFYRIAYPDVASVGDSPLSHYISYGRDEGRFPLFAVLAATAARLEAAALFDEKSYRRSRREYPGKNLTDAEHYLLFGAPIGIPINTTFDSSFYEATYPDVKHSAIIHYMNIGQRQRRLTNKKQFDHDLEIVRSGIDAVHYLEYTDDPSAIVDPALHYMVAGVFEGLSPSPDFEPSFYEENYPDIAIGPILPFVHYIQYGRNEGRVGRPDIASRFRNGGQHYDFELPTLVVANHESSRTGAPLVGLALARSFGQSHNIVTLLGRDLELSHEFSEVSCAIFAGRLSESEGRWLFREIIKRYKASCVITNSVETSDFALAADQVGLPVVALIHEFAEYTFPKGKMADLLASADRVIVPADVIRKSVERDAVIHLGAKPSNVLVKPQGYLPQPPLARRGNDLNPEELRAWLKERSGVNSPRVVLGAGYTQIRKGTDIFVQTAAALRSLNEDAVFLWVGDGYNPGSDWQFSVYLEAMIERSGVQDRVFFLGAQQRIDDILSIADVFYLPSRMDPFPNVVIDAMNSALPIVCFEQGTGSAEIFADKRAVGSVVAYGDPAAAAKAINAYLREGKRYPENAELVERNFDFDDYVATIREQMGIATQARRELEVVLQRVHNANVFDADFHAGDRMPISAIDRNLATYVRRAARGFLRYSPTPGFSDGMYKVSKGLPVDAPVCALDMAITASSQSPPRTHDCYNLADLTSARRQRRVAIHLHIHYPDTIPCLLAPIERLRMPVDLYVTTTGQVNRLRTEAAFLDYERGSVTFADGPNRGRDIGPFITVVGDMIGDKNYDLVGHFHGKKSLSSSEAMGRNWRDFLLGTLLGEPGDILKIFELFAANDKLGLVFAEDRHEVGWSQNRTIADTVAHRMKPKPVLADFSVFPLGNMFWARPDAMTPLWNAGFTWTDYPVEPIKDDGTILHAIERMLPAICESTGMHWATVYKEGLSW